MRATSHSLTFALVAALVSLSSAHAQGLLGLFPSYTYTISDADYAMVRQMYELGRYKYFTGKNPPNEEIEKARAGTALTKDEVESVNYYLSVARNFNVEVVRERTIKERYIREAEERRVADERSARDRYHSLYEGIQSPDDAASFISKYKSNDPERLISTANERGYVHGISVQKECISNWQRIIENENEIRREVGFVDKNKIYVAGSNIIVCKKKLNELLQSCKKTKYPCFGPQ